MSATRSRAVLATVALALLLSACGGGTQEASSDVTLDTDATPSPVAQAQDDGEGEGADIGGTTDEADEDAVTDDDLPAEDVCAGREDEAFIEVLSPAPNATVADGFEVTGCGNTFEATYLWRLEQDGAVVLQDFGTMTCGSGCVGTFAFTVEAGVTGPVALVLYEESAEDGSEQHAVTIPLEIG